MAEIRRFAVIFNGSLPMKDEVAALDRAFVRELLPLLLDEQKFDAIYRLDDECKTHDVQSEVICLPPTLDSVRTVVSDLTEKRKVDGSSSVFTLINGHGSVGGDLAGGVSGKAFAALLDALPASVSRITILHQCFGGAFASFGLVDENDLLWAYSGSDEVNITDASGMAILFGKDANGDGVTSLQEIFWQGQSYIYNKFTPYYRRFVFKRGPRFVDRGLGTAEAKPPFPASLIEVRDVLSYLKLAKAGSARGVTVIGYEGKNGGEALRKKMEEAAKREGGFTQFIWVNRALALEVLGRSEAARLESGSFYKIFYAGSENRQSTFDEHSDIGKTLENVYVGEKIEEK